MKKYIGYIIGAILLILVIWFLSTRKEQPYNNVVYKSNNTVTVKLLPMFVDTVLNVGLEQLGDSGMFVMVKPLPDALKQQGDVTVKAHIRGEGDSYIIWMDLLSRSESIDVLSHELIHLNQYKTKQLVVVGDKVVWQGDTLNISDIPYNERPWEIDAFNKGKELSNKVRKILY